MCSSKCEQCKKIIWITYFSQRVGSPYNTKKRLFWYYHKSCYKNLK